MVPKGGRRSRPGEVDFREVINAVRYLVGSGSRLADAADPFRRAWQTVYGWFRELARRFFLQTVQDMGPDAGPRATRAQGQSHGGRYR
ncbi:transposase [Mesorhizobium sp. M0904]